MKTLRVPVVPVLAAGSVALLLASTGGAVAGHLITGKQIKNGSVDTVDLSHRAQDDLRGVTRLQVVSRAGDFVGPGEVSRFKVSCPKGKVALAGISYWAAQHTPVDQYRLAKPGTWVSYSTNQSTENDRVFTEVTCAFSN